MPEKKLIVILGITGLQGSSVHAVFKNEPGWRIRGITRNPSKHEALTKQGVELVSADLDDEASLEKAFADANAIYAVTDFWQFLQPGSSAFSEAEKEGKKPNEIAMAREIQQGKNIVHAAAKQLATLERLVLSTLADSKKWSKGEVKWNLHFDGKAAYTQYLKDEFPKLAKVTSYLQMGFYLSNWKMNPMFAPQKQADGMFVVKKLGVPNGKPIPYVNPPNDTGHFVRALVLEAPAGTDLLGYCELMTNEEYWELWGRVNGVQCSSEIMDIEEAVKLGVPDWLAEEVGESGLFTTKYGWAGGDPEVKHPKDVGVDVSKLTKVEDWVRKEDWSSVL